MATASTTNTFVNLTPADATEVNANFTDLVTFLNASVVHRDGSKAMTAAFDAGSFKLTNVATGTADTDAVNKAQMDAVTARVGGSWSRTTNLSCPTVTLTSVTFTTEGADTDGFATPTTATFTIPADKAGLYSIAFSAVLDAAIGGYGRIVVAGRTYDFSINAGRTSGGIVLPLAVADTVVLQIYNSSSTANVTAALIDIYKVGA